MPEPRAWLVDVYETVLGVDFAAVAGTVAEHLGVDPAALRAALDAESQAANTSPTGMTDATPRLLARCGVSATEDSVREVVESHLALMRRHCTVHPDAVAFLHRLRAAGAPVALVSNCSEDTRPLLVELGLDRLVDAVVLSCEVGVAKPGAAIYRHALDALGVEAARGVLLDDQPLYCHGALAIGMDAVRIARGAGPSPAPVDAPSGRPLRTVRSCDELVP